MQPWVIWMIKHRMSFVVKSLVVLSYPIQLMSYADEAWKDIINTIKSIDYEENQNKTIYLKGSSE